MVVQQHGVGRVRGRGRARARAGGALEVVARAVRGAVPHVLRHQHAAARAAHAEHAQDARYTRRRGNSLFSRFISCVHALSRI